MRFAGALALVAASLIYQGLLSRLRAYELARAGAHPWWFGYARDGANLFAAALYLGGLVLAGLPGPAALVAAVALLLAHYVIDWALGRRLSWRFAPFAVAPLIAAAGATLALAAAPVAVALGRLLDAAAPR